MYQNIFLPLLQMCAYDKNKQISKTILPSTKSIAGFFVEFYWDFVLKLDYTHNFVLKIEIALVKTAGMNFI